MSFYESLKENTKTEAQLRDEKNQAIRQEYDALVRKNVKNCIMNECKTAAEKGIHSITVDRWYKFHDDEILYWMEEKHAEEFLRDMIIVLEEEGFPSSNVEGTVVKKKSKNGLFNSYHYYDIVVRVHW